VSPSRFEGHPTAVIEAMAARCPVVLSDIPAHREIADDKRARFFRADDATDAARSIRAALCDPAESKDLISNAPRTVEEWSFGANAERYAEMYERISSQSAESSRPRTHAHRDVTSSQRSTPT